MCKYQAFVWATMAQYRAASESLVLAEESYIVQIRGAKARTRTADRTIFSRELYQLSYLGVVCVLGAFRWWAIEGSNL